MSFKIDELELQIQTGSNNASSSLDQLKNSLASLKSITKGGAGLTTITKQISALNTALSGTNTSGLSKIAGIVTALEPLEKIGKSNLGSTLNQLKKIPEITKGLDTSTLSDFAVKIREVTAAILPLSTEMQKVSNGFSKLPTNIQKAINANAKLTTSNKKTGDSFKQIKIAAVIQNLKTFVNAARRVADTVSDWITESNAYVENLNLFTVAMGEYAQAAQTYAEKVSEVMGIDPSEWMRNQGVFMTLATGFGIASDKAATMSQQLAQLGYDISSFYNINVEDAMLKLQSGLSGELEPLRRLGWDLSQAKLQAIALSLGIDRTVNSMTQAEKASLRYYAIMTQVTTVQGDMARTLNAPANQLRIMRAQLTMATRALGNIFIPMLNKILPYAIAFLRVIRDIASELANIAGFSFPEVDYSSVNMSSIIPEEESTIEDITKDIEPASKAVEKATKNVAKATKSTKDLAKSVKKIKDYTLGIDELNIISKDSSNLDDLNDLIPESALNDTIDNLDEVTDALKDAGEALGSFDVPVPTYDFLGDAINKQTDKIYDKLSRKIKPIVKWIKDNIGLIKGLAIGVGTAILTWKVASGLMTSFNLISTFLKNLPAKFKTAGENGSSMFKKALGLTFMITGFAFEFSGFKAIGKGDATGVDWAKAIGGAILGVGGALLFFGTGPAGWAVGIGLAITMAITGITVGQNEKISEMVSDAFYQFNGGKITVTEFADSFKNLMTAITDVNQPIIDNGKTIDSTMENDVKPAVSDINDISRAIENGAYTAAEKIPDLVTSFETLKTGTEKILDTVYDNVVRAVSGSLFDALTGAGVYVPELLSVLAGVKGEVDTTFDTLTTSFEETKEAFDDGKISPKEYADKILELTKKMQDLVGQSDPVIDAFGDVSLALEDMNWESPEAKDNAFEIIKDAASNAKTSANDAYKEIEKEVKTMREWSDDPSYQLALDQILLGNETTRTTQLNSIDKQVQGAFDIMQKSMVDGTARITEKVTEEWNNMGKFEKWWNGGNEAAYVSKALGNYQKNIISPIESEMQTTFDDLGIKASPWASNAMYKVLTSMFTYSPTTNGAIVNGFATDVETALSQALSKIEAKMSLDLTVSSHVSSSNSLHGGGGATFASGGYPTTGQLFLAREAGPEMVGTMGGRTTVANNDQIVNGISQGVYNAVVSAMSRSGNGNGGSEAIYVYLDGKQITASVEKRQRERGRTIVTGGAF